MSNIVPVSKDKFSALRWKRYTNYSFAFKDSLMPLRVTELSKAITAFPVAFVKSGEDFVLVGIAGLYEGRNYFVSQDGQWLGRYVPANYRGYPFMVASTSDGHDLLCVREESGLVGEAGAAGFDVRFFNDDGSLSSEVDEILQFLTQLRDDSVRTNVLVAKLASLGLIVPWEIELDNGDEKRRLEGLYKIDESALGEGISPDELSTLAKSGALLVAYAQLLSMQHLQSLASFIETMQNQERGKDGLLDSNGDLDLEFLKGDDTINFG